MIYINFVCPFASAQSQRNEQGGYDKDYDLYNHDIVFMKMLKIEFYQ